MNKINKDHSINSAQKSRYNKNKKKKQDSNSTKPNISEDLNKKKQKAKKKGISKNLDKKNQNDDQVHEIINITDSSNNVTAPDLTYAELPTGGKCTVIKDIFQKIDLKPSSLIQSQSNSHINYNLSSIHDQNQYSSSQNQNQQFIKQLDQQKVTQAFEDDFTDKIQSQKSYRDTEQMDNQQIEQQQKQNEEEDEDIFIKLTPENTQNTQNNQQVKQVQDIYSSFEIYEDQNQIEGKVTLSAEVENSDNLKQRQIQMAIENNEFFNNKQINRDNQQISKNSSLIGGAIDDNIIEINDHQSINQQKSNILRSQQAYKDYNVNQKNTSLNRKLKMNFDSSINFKYASSQLCIPLKSKANDLIDLDQIISDAETDINNEQS